MPITSWLLVLLLATPDSAIVLAPGQPAPGGPPAGPVAWVDKQAPPPTAALPEVVEGGSRGSRRLVLVLHGGSYRPRTPRELAERALDPLDDGARQLGLRAVAPIAPEGWLGWGRGDQTVATANGLDASTVWASSQGEALVLAFLDHEVRLKRADPRRIYLAGHGAGATAAIHLAARHPERFAAIALWSGTPSPEWEWPGSSNGSRNGDGDRREERDAPVAAPASPRVVGLVGDPVPRLATVPVYLWTGQQDDILDRQALTLFITRMRDHELLDRGHELVWETGPGGHDYGPQGARPGLGFLKKHRKARRR